MWSPLYLLHHNDTRDEFKSFWICCWKVCFCWANLYPSRNGRSLQVIFDNSPNFMYTSLKCLSFLSTIVSCYKTSERKHVLFRIVQLYSYDSYSPYISMMPCCCILFENGLNYCPWARCRFATISVRHVRQQSCGCGNSGVRKISQLNTFRPLFVQELARQTALNSLG